MKANTNIDQLKSVWEKLSNDNLKQKLSPSEIEEVARKKSKHEIDIIKRKFLTENIIGLLLLIVMIIFINIKGNNIEAIMFNLLMGVSFIILLIPTVNLFKIGKLKNQSTSSFLNKAVPILKQVIKSITTLTIIIAPISFTCGVFTGIIHGSGKTEFVDIYDILCTKVNLSIIVVLLTITSLTGYLAVKYYYRLLYKKNIDNLEELMNDLNEIEETTELE